jgi:hypothetical protein
MFGPGLREICGRPELPELVKQLKGLGADVVTTESELRNVLSVPPPPSPNSPPPPPALTACH